MLNWVKQFFPVCIVNFYPTEIHRFSDNFRGDKNFLIRLNSLNDKSQSWGRSFICLDRSQWIKACSKSTVKANRRRSSTALAHFGLVLVDSEYSSIFPVIKHLKKEKSNTTHHKFLHGFYFSMIQYDNVANLQG